MSLLELAKSDMESITGNTGEFAVDMILITKDKTEINIKGLHTKHHLGIDTDGNAVNSKKAHISFAEKQLTDQAYSIRNTDGEVDLKKWNVKVKDSTGISKTYTMQSWFPDETIGFIVCILEDFKNV